MPAPLTTQQIALYISKRRAGSRQEVAAAAAGISVSSAHRIDAGRIQPKAAKPRSRRRPDPLAAVWEPLLLPLLERHSALTPTTLLEYLQEPKPDRDWSPVKRNLQLRMQHWIALHGPAPEVMFPLAYQPGEIGFCDFTRVKRVEITPRYQALCAHYGLSPSRNNRGVAHENGIVEAPHGHVKRRLEQNLILRGNCDFEELAVFGELLAEVFSALNAPRQRRYEQEFEQLAPLPAFRFADYERLTVRLHHDRLVVFLGSDWVCQLPRAYGAAGEKRAWCIDLEHLIDGLRAKPRALLHCRYQRHLFPDQRWWEFRQQLLAGGDRDGAARLMAEAHYVAVRVVSFELVVAFLEQAHRRQSLSLPALQQRFRVPPRCPSLPDPVIPQHRLAPYVHLVPGAALSGGGSSPATAGSNN
jgi:hypothetical protein